MPYETSNALQVTISEKSCNEERRSYVEEPKMCSKDKRGETVQKPVNGKVKMLQCPQEKIV